jgi:hypothetical protein
MEASMPLAPGSGDARPAAILLSFEQAGVLGGRVTVNAVFPVSLTAAQAAALDRMLADEGFTSGAQVFRSGPDQANYTYDTLPEILLGVIRQYRRQGFGPVRAKVQR